MSADAAARAGLLVWRHRRWLRRALIVAGSFGAVLLLIPLLIVALVVSIASSSTATQRISKPSSLPPAARPWIQLVETAGQAFGVNPYLLLAILKEETAFGTHPATYGANFAGCCHGPFQMNIADGPPSTWDLVKDAYRAAPRPSHYVHPARPHPSVYDSFDAAMAAAALLRSKVRNAPLPALDDTAWRAASAYNGAGPVADAYADRVLAAARQWEADAQRVSVSPPPGAGGILTWPVRGPVTSGFGPRWGRLHAGIDIAAPAGRPILAAATGRVLQSGWVGGYGNFTCLVHAARFASCYAHQSRFARGMVPGRPVLRGQVIGWVGCTGRCYGDHLHFEVHTSTTITSATAVDPLPYLRGDR